ncbi:hypothetical protein CFC21_016168, partial [Triticum aestivum]
VLCMPEWTCYWMGTLLPLSVLRRHRGV